MRKMIGKEMAETIEIGEAGIPITPGSKEAVEDIHEAMGVIDSIGYPVIVKASAGGGGKGMKIVTKEEELADSLRACQRIAESAFGSSKK